MTTRGDGAVVALPLFHEDDGGSIPTSPLQLRFRGCDVHQAESLNNRWHSRFPHIDKQLLRGDWAHCFVAQYGNLLLAVGIWSRPIAANRMRDGDRLLELRRFAVCSDAPKNTASRMLGWMVREVSRIHPGLLRVVSYQDTSVHAGTIYKACGWTPVSRSKFVDWNTHGQVKGRVTQSTADKIRWEKQIR